MTSVAQPSYLSNTRITFTPAKTAPGGSALVAAHKPRAMEEFPMNKHFVMTCKWHQTWKINPL